MPSKTGLGTAFKFLIAAMILAGATQLFSIGAISSSVEADNEPGITLPDETELMAGTESTIEPTLASAQIAPVPANGFRVTHPLQTDDGVALSFGEFIWNDDGVPEGQLRIVVDLGAEMLYAYRGGYEIGRSVILYGHDDNPTPTGSFTITEKNEDHISNIYFVPMPYMMRLTNDGIAIHGNTVEQGYASRGCIGLPNEFAAMLFAETDLGAQVRISWGSPMDEHGNIVMTGIPEDRTYPTS